ncbi:MAG: S24 family peptidase [Oribacterium sp.]|nr:S24 family peptidase [Oribacterium sp.]
MFLGEIIRTYREEHGISMQEFADRSGLSKPYISQLEKNRNPKTDRPIVPSPDTFQKVADAMGISFDALIRKVDKNQPLALKKMKIESSDHLPRNAILPSARSLPIIGTICAGGGRLCFDDNLGHFVIDLDVHADYCLKVSGDSMIGANIYNGDIVFILKDCDFIAGKIYAVEFNDSHDAMLKKVEQDGENIILTPCNPAYHSIVANYSEIRIVGQCVGVYHSYV